MRSGIVAVWDPDREFGENLSTYLRRQGGFGSSVVFYGEEQKMQRAVEGGQVVVVVTGQSHREEESSYSVPTIVLTSEKVTESVDESRVAVVPIGADLPMEKRWYFYKYQPARQLVRMLSEIQEHHVKNQKAGHRPARIRGIYSPLGGCLKTSLGLVIGCLLAEEKPCLFLSLEAHSGFRTLFGRQYPVDLSDLFALLRQGGDPLELLPEAMQPFGKLQYVPPVIWPVDVREAEFSEVKELLQRLALCGKFEEIILDVGQDLACPEKILQLCDTIYQPEKEDIFSRGKLAEYEAYLRVTGQESLCERTRSISISRLTAGMEDMPLDQWKRWEQMIPMVRQILQEEVHDE